MVGHGVREKCSEHFT